jgi:hypothetical protein
MTQELPEVQPQSSPQSSLQLDEIMMRLNELSSGFGPLVEEIAQKGYGKPIMGKPRVGINGKKSFEINHSVDKPGSMNITENGLSDLVMLNHIAQILPTGDGDYVVIGADGTIGIVGPLEGINDEQAAKLRDEFNYKLTNSSFLQFNAETAKQLLDPNKRHFLQVYGTLIRTTLNLDETNLAHIEEKTKKAIQHAKENRPKQLERLKNLQEVITKDINDLLKERTIS